MDCSLPGSIVYGILQARILEWVAMPSIRFNPGIEPVSPALQVDSLPLSHQGSSPNHWTPREVPGVVRFEETVANASLQDTIQNTVKA